jgi:hypothetical protein
MQVTKKIFKSIFILLCFLYSFLLFAEETTHNVETILIEDFDNPDSGRKWIVEGSEFVDAKMLKYEYVKAWPDALFGRNVQKTDLKCLGIKAGFIRQGYNYLEIIPAKSGEGGKNVPDPIILKGNVKTMDIWVWGSNYNYYLEAHVLDSFGIPHVLSFGNLNFAGWKNLTARISLAIPQSKRHLLQEEQLRLTKFVLWTRPSEKVDEFYIYLDQIKILTDTYILRFDGDELADKEYINQLWGSEGGEK